MSVDVTTSPSFLTARSGVYTARALRQPFADLLAPGVLSDVSFKVAPRAAGANMSVDVGDGATLNLAYVRGTDTADQGVYRVTLSGTLNLPIAANASGNPRLDAVILRVLDSEHAGSSDKAILDVVQGTPTSGATKDNRSGAAALPANSLWLGDVLVASGTGAINAAALRDHRPRARVAPSLGAVPAGFVMASPYAAGSQPAGWYPCDGSALDRFLYADLYAALGGSSSPWGQGDGSTTFNVPNLVGRSIFGAGGIWAYGATGGEISHTLTVGEMPAHAHPGSVARLSVGSTAPDGSLARMGDASGATQDSQVVTVAPQGGGQPHNNLPPYAVMEWVVKL